MLHFEEVLLGFFKEGYRRNVISPFFIKNILVNFEKVETYNDRISAVL